MHRQGFDEPITGIDRMAIWLIMVPFVIVMGGMMCVASILTVVAAALRDCSAMLMVGMGWVSTRLKAWIL